MSLAPLRLILIGFGSVGRGLVDLLARRAAEPAARALPIVAVATRRGAVIDAAGIDLASLLALDDGDLRRHPQFHELTPAQVIAQVDADALVEVSSTDLTSGEPATSSIRAAFARGMHVVTANKGPLALHLADLRAAAAAAGVHFGYEGTVMSGTPALWLGERALAGCRISEIRGIVNGTTNYILTQMEGGMPYPEALAAAQRLGYAETDPTGDVEGHDAAGKAAILANVLLGARLTPADVTCQGITHLTADDVAAAQAAGERWKLIARIWRDGDAVHADVRPTRLPLAHPLAGVGGATNAITYTTDLLGDVTLIGPGAGGIATAFALLSDLSLLPTTL